MPSVYLINLQIFLALLWETGREVLLKDPNKLIRVQVLDT